MITEGAFSREASPATRSPPMAEPPIPMNTTALASAYALGRRAKWKDYVDMYFIIKKYKGLSAIVTRAASIFGKEFNEKVFRVQLSYFADIDFSEEVIFMPGFKIKTTTIKSALTKFSLEN